METINEINSELKFKEYEAVSLELEIALIQDQIYCEEDETHIIFLTDHISVLQYELDRLNADIYLLRKDLKILENEKKFQTN